MIVLCFLYYFLWALNTLMILIRKNSKAIMIMTWALLFVLFVSNSGLMGDAYKYKMDYELNAFGTDWSEIGYVILKNICKTAGLWSYNQYLCVIYLLGSLLIFWGGKKVDLNYHILFATCMGFIFPALATAIRFFVALSIFMFSLPYLLNNKKISYIVLCIVAASFHKSMLIMFVFLLCDNSYKYNTGIVSIRKIIISICALAAGAIAGFTLLFRKLPFEEIIRVVMRTFNIQNNKIDEYFKTVTHYGWIILFTIYVANLLFAIATNRRNKYMNRTLNIRRLCKFNLSFNIVSSILLPIAVLNLVVFRLYILETFMNVVVASVFLRKKDYNTFNSGYYSSYKLYFDKYFLLFSIIVIAWLVPAYFKLNSITVNGVINNSLLVGVG